MVGGLGGLDDPALGRGGAGTLAARQQRPSAAPAGARLVRPRPNGGVKHYDNGSALTAKPVATRLKLLSSARNRRGPSARCGSARPRRERAAISYRTTIATPLTYALARSRPGASRRTALVAERVSFLRASLRMRSAFTRSLPLAGK